MKSAVLSFKSQSNIFFFGMGDLEPMIMSVNFKKRMSTRDVFNGWNVQKIWKKEDSSWATRDLFRRPHMSLQYPCFAPQENWERPVICQNIFWSRDGSSIVTVHDDYGIRQYFTECLENENDSDQLVPFMRMFKNRSIVTSQVHPLYSLYNDMGEFNLILTACRDLPLQIYSLQDSSGLCLNHYNVINIESSVFEIPFALNWTEEDQFLVGSVKNRVSLFNCHRSSPIWTFKSKRRNSSNKSIVSCFSERPQGELRNTKHSIFGTYKNQLHLLDHRMQCIQLLHSSSHGNGYIQLLESVNGHYLYALKRNSIFVDVLDTRKSHSLTNQLKLPFRIGSQKHKASITNTNGLLIGTDDGKIVGWSSSAIEFGAIDRNGETYGNGSGEPPELTLDAGINLGSRINIAQQSSSNPGICALSYSPDKMMQKPDISACSGICIVDLPTYCFGL